MIGVCSFTVSKVPAGSSSDGWKGRFWGRSNVPATGVKPGVSLARFGWGWEPLNGRLSFHGAFCRRLEGARTTNGGHERQHNWSAKTHRVLQRMHHLYIRAAIP